VHDKKMWGAVVLVGEEPAAFSLFLPPPRA